MSHLNLTQFRAFDYDGFKNSLFQVAKTAFPQWTDTLESNQGVMFIEWLAFIASNIAYTQNFHARQAFVPTVTEAKNLQKLAKQFAYIIPDNTSAVVDVVISNADGVPFLNDVTIPAGTQLLTQGATSLIFETIQNLTIPAGAVSGTVGAKHQETKVETDISDGTIDYQTRMTYSPFITNSMTVVVDGVAWAQVENFLNSNGLSEHYIVEVDSDQVATVTFGNGINGKIPLANSSLEFTYKVGGGTIGNVSPGSITEIPGIFYDVNNNLVDLVVTNPLPATGGGDREAVEVTKIRMPASLASKEITIDYEDFETNIKSVAGVARVTVRTVNDDSNIPENTVYCFILPTLGDVLSAALEAEILAAMENYPRPLTQSMYLIGPAFETIDIEIQDLVVDEDFADGTGTKASALITLNNNTFDVGDAVVVNGVTFLANIDFVVGIDLIATASNLAGSINASLNPLLQDIEAIPVNNTVTVQARTTGPEGNAYTLAEVDGGTDNITISGALFDGGEDSTLQAKVRAAIETFFGRTNLDEEGEYTVGFGQTVYRNRLIWVIQDVLGVESFNLVTPAADVDLDINEFPKYTLKFTTS